MIESIIPNPNSQDSFYHIFATGDYEYCDPYEQLRLMSVIPQIATLHKHLDFKQIPFTLALNKVILARVCRDWDKKAVQANKMNVSSWLSLLDLTKKKDQENHLKRASISSPEFFAFLLQAGTKKGFTISHYKVQHTKGVDKSKLPTFIHLNESGYIQSSETTLTKGQMKGVIEQRHVLVAKFFDKGADWHCMFLTYKSLRGGETWKDGQPHMHYISKGWGLSRQEVLTKLMSEKYSFNSVPHIDFTR